MLISPLTSFLGWCTIINLAILIITSLSLILFKKQVVDIHSNLLTVEKAALPNEYFRYLANYKVLIFVFNLVPYIALKLLQKTKKALIENEGLSKNPQTVAASNTGIRVGILLRLIVSLKPVQECDIE